MDLTPIQIVPTQIAPTQIALVKATLPRLTRRPMQSAMAFEMHLARYAPALARALPLSPVPLLADAIARVDTPAALLRHLAPLAHTLRTLGLTPRAYMALHAALMDMVSEHLAHDPELEEAWSDVIGLTLSTMVNAAHGTRIQAMPLAA